MRRRLTAVMLLTLASPPLAAQRDSLLVTNTWLASHLRDPNVVVLHVGDRAGFDKQHIPGARLVTLDDVSVSDRTGGGLSLEMPSTERLHDALEALGISNDSRVIVYDATDRLTPATRVVFTLDYAGLGARTSLLDGGLSAWSKSGHEMTAAPTPPSTGKLSALRTKPIVVTADFVRAHLGKPSVAIVDARAAAFYDGTQTGGGAANPHRTGHVAGARSVPYTDISENTFIKTGQQLAALFDRAGIAPGDTVIGYCHIGQQATALLFGARLTGHPVLLYDGSFEDWSRRADLPVDNPSAKRP